MPPKVLRTMSDETMILPDVVANTIVQDVARYTGLTFTRAGVYRQQLLMRAERLYMCSPSFRKKIRSQGNAGRDYLYVFMRHWYAGLLLDHERHAVHKLRMAGVWDTFANGQALPDTK